MDSILRRYGSKTLSLEEKAELGLLPDILTIAQIARLWAYDSQHKEPNKDQERGLREAMKEAVRVKALRGKGKPDYHTTTTEFDATPQWLRGYGEPIRRRATAILDGSGVKISRSHFQIWLQQEGGWPLPANCFLRYWWKEGMPTKKENVIEPRIARIKEVITSLRYDPQAIPYGGKKAIGSVCLEDRKLFTKDTFEKAWQEGNRRKLWEVENADQYKNK